MKGKSVETKFEKSSVIRQPNAFKSQRQSILGKPAIFSDSLAKKDFSKSKPITTQNVSNDFSKPVTAQILPQNRLPFVQNTNLVEIILFIVDSGCSKHMTGNLKLLTNFVEKFLGTVKFGNDQIAPILGYGDLVQGTITIKRVYYVEGLNHNLFSVGQFCDADLEVAFRKSTCYIRDLKGNDLLTGSRGTDLYSISLQDSTTLNPICLMAKATSSQAWLWHRRLSHLNFDTINLLSKNNIVNGLPKLKFVKDHLCSSCELGKAKRKSFHSKTTPHDSKRRLQRLPHDLCGPMRVESINGKKYVLVIVDDFSRYTWTHSCGQRRNTGRFLNDFHNLVQRGLHMLKRNRTLVEAARTMLSAAKVPLFFWAEAIATTCFTQNRSLVIPRHEKTPYHIINARNPQIVLQDGSDHVSSDPGPQCSTTVLEQDSLSPGPQSQENVPQVAETVTTSNELELLYSPMKNINCLIELDVWELVRQTLCKNVFNLKMAHEKHNVMWKNTIIPQQITSRRLRDKLKRKGIDSKRHLHHFFGLECCTIVHCVACTQIIYSGNNWTLKHISLRPSKRRSVRNQPGCIDDTYHPDKVYRLKKALYGLKQHQERGMMNSPTSWLKKVMLNFLLVGTEYQLADLFTKALSEDRFKYLVRQLGMRCLTPDELEVLAIESA
ncbi:retrovirus-related pol polyprotein from transposon TNT 1-94 [Tanacetum coccineum]